MERNDIINILVAREGYTRTNAIIATHEARSLSAELQPLFESWLVDGTQNNFSAEGYNLLELMEKSKSSYLAALLNLDWIIKEPNKAIPVIDSLLQK